MVQNSMNMFIDVKKKCEKLLRHPEMILKIKKIVYVIISEISIGNQVIY
jgi:hypothetical protein